eukprot:TRINITY_DN24732_c0_g1_i2.p1 TRINITY_DN24732_c0_g1~~TRINITY_DN24732_c0_g1_i2.p1  ORF type:complete len:159 (+),score=20.45 TRINITY_DN24732_c0_g1_i2:83-559(+)
MASSESMESFSVSRSQESTALESGRAVDSEADTKDTVTSRQLTKANLEALVTSFWANHPRSRMSAGTQPKPPPIVLPETEHSSSSECDSEADTIDSGSPWQLAELQAIVDAFCASQQRSREREIATSPIDTVFAFSWGEFPCRISIMACDSSAWQLHV